MGGGFTCRMMSKPMRPDPAQWARKLYEAAAEVRIKAGRPNGLQLARRLERYAEAILFPTQDRDPMLRAVGGDD